MSVDHDPIGIPDDRTTDDSITDRVRVAASGWSLTIFSDDVAAAAGGSVGTAGTVG